MIKGIRYFFCKSNFFFRRKNVGFGKRLKLKTALFDINFFSYVHKMCTLQDLSVAHDFLAQEVSLVKFYSLIFFIEDKESQIRRKILYFAVLFLLLILVK
jgi:hypothetical protein